MKKDEFLKKLGYNNGYDVRIVPKTNNFNMNSLFKQLKSLKMITEYINFPCSFDKEGICNGHFMGEMTLQCCCKECYKKNAYLNIIEEKDINKYAIRFSKKTGFWRKNKGCILPRDLRSKTCITFICYKVNKKTIKNKYNLNSSLIQLCNVLIELEQKIRNKCYDHNLYYKY